MDYTVEKHEPVVLVLSDGGRCCHDLVSYPGLGRRWETPLAPHPPPVFNWRHGSKVSCVGLFDCEGFLVWWIDWLTARHSASWGRAPTERLNGVPNSPSKCRVRAGPLQWSHNGLVSSGDRGVWDERRVRFDPTLKWTNNGLIWI